MNSDLATLGDTDGTAAADTIVLNATDSLGNSAVTTDIGVTVTTGPVISAPSTATLGVGKGAVIPGVSITESGASGTETFTVTVAD